MKILKVEVANYRKIRALMLELGGSNLAVAGSTGQGKTTAISVLWESLKMVGDPITHGEKKGQIKITLGDGQTEVFVTRSFTAKTTPITIHTSKGEKISAAEFATWFCGLGDNPQRILDMKPKEQVEALLEAVKLPEGVDLGEMDAARAKAGEERLNLQRDGTRDAERLGEEPPHPDRVDVSAILHEVEKANVANRARQMLEGALVVAEAEVRHSAKEETEARAHLEEQQRALVIAEEGLKVATEASKETGKREEELKQRLAGRPLIDTTAIQSKQQAANDTNRAADRWTEWKKKADEVAALRAAYKAKNEEVKTLDLAKKTALENAEWPIDGLTISEGSVLYNDTPLEQCGHSEQMLVCGALAAKTISRHRLSVVRMDGIESMSKEDFNKLERVFVDHDIQVLSSRVSRGDLDDGEILIVDGAIQVGDQ